MNEYRIKEYNGKFYIQTKRTYRKYFWFGRLEVEWVKTNKNGGVFVESAHSSNHLLSPLDSKKEAIQCINRLKKIREGLNKIPKYYTSEGVEIK